MEKFVIAEDVFVSSRDNKKIFIRTAKRKTEKAVIILHGACEHSGRYNSLIKFLWKRGYSVFVPDLRGHGKSEGKRVHIVSFTDYLSDLWQMLDIVSYRNQARNLGRNLGRQEIPHPKIHLLGHSMGGLIAARYIQEYQPDIVSLILSSPLFGWNKMPKVKILAAKVISKVWSTFYFRNPVQESTLSHDESVVRKYRQDPLVYNIGTARLGDELTKNFDILLEKAELIKMPLLFLVGGADRITDTEAAKQFFEKVGSEKKECYIFGEMYHEIFNEVEKEKPLGILADWLRRLDE
jgi:alpha-beta hydrolase superfamily lysophospholipase